MASGSGGLPGTSAVLVAGVAGQVSAAVAGALPWWLLACSAVLYPVAAQASRRADGRRTGQLRMASSVVAVVLVLVSLPGLLGIADALQIRGTLGLLLVGIQVAQALTWNTRRDLGTGLTTAVALLVLGASYAPDVLVGFPVLVGWAAVLVALGQSQGSRLAQLLPATALALVLGLVAFLLVPVPVSAGIRSKLGGLDQSGLARATQGATAFSGQRLDLRLRGALSSEPVAAVSASSPELWRSSTFDSYDGRSWSRPPDRVLDAPGPTYEVATTQGPTRVDDVVLSTRTGGTVWSPGALLTVTADDVGVPLRNAFGDVQLPGLVGSYRVRSAVGETDPAVLRAARGTDETDVRWRRLPRVLPDRVQALARSITEGTTNRWDAAEAIATWLRANATYRLDSPVPRPGEDAVDRFLFVDRTGFCEQFASAEAVLLRSLGIPARLVTGLAYGKVDGASRVFRVSDLHAWVELWVPGVGWVTSDPTAGVPLAGGTGASLRAEVAAAVSKALRSATQLPGGKPALAAVLGLGALAVVVVRVPRRRRAAASGLAVRDPGPALAAFLRWDARRTTGRQATETLRELGRRVDPEVTAALEVVERELYAAMPPDTRAAVEVLERS